MSIPPKSVNPNNINLNLEGENVIGVEYNNERSSPVSDPGSRAPSPHFFPEGFRRIASRLGNNIFGAPKATLTEKQIENEALYKVDLNYQEYPTPEKLSRIKKLAANAGFRSNLVKTLRSMAAFKFSESTYDSSMDQNMKALVHALGTTNLSSGGKRKTRPKKRQTKKLKIPPALAEEAIEVLAEVAVGGKRRKTRKNK